ncbi:hypothetical protein AUV07_14980 [Microbacterium sp. CH1]|nr:hypothetical protein AUV07_14980 [Microbacterium sp. CH1]
MFSNDAVAWNNEVATCVERWADRLLATDSLIGRVVSDEILYLFFCRERVTIDQMRLHPYDSLISVVDLAPGGGFRERVWIGGRARDDGTLIRLSLPHSFPLMGRRDSVSRAQATPGIDRVRVALSRLIASAPPLMTQPLLLALR